MKLCYLDNNATTPIDPRVVQVMVNCYEAGHMNSASQHRLGRGARRVVENAREGISRILGADVSHHDADYLVFTSGATEANNLAICGFSGKAPGHLIVSAIEHPSVLVTPE